MAQQIDLAEVALTTPSTLNIAAVTTITISTQAKCAAHAVVAMIQPARIQTMAEPIRTARIVISTPIQALDNLNAPTQHSTLTILTLINSAASVRAAPSTTTT